MFGTGQSWNKDQPLTLQPFKGSMAADSLNKLHTSLVDNRKGYEKARPGRSQTLQSSGSKARVTKVHYDYECC